jgi:hypothetical protein
VQFARTGGALVRLSLSWSENSATREAERFVLQSIGRVSPTETRERGSADKGLAGACGSGSPQPTLVLNEKPVEKHGSGVTYRLRLGAHCLYHAKSCLGEFYRKMKWRLSAVTATAHKLARIAGLSHMKL